MTFNTARNAILLIVAILSFLIGSAYWFGRHHYGTAIGQLKDQAKLLESEIHVTQKRLEDLQKQYVQINDWMGKEAKARVKKKAQAVKDADADGLARILVDFVRSDTGHGWNGCPVSGDDLGSQ